MSDNKEDTWYLGEEFESSGGLSRMVYWQLNNLCNFRCRYCFCGEEKLSAEHPLCGKYSPEHVAKCFSDTGYVWHVHMSGGEPFLYPDFIKLCRCLTKDHHISMNTNLSTSNVRDFADGIDPVKVLFINAGYHSLGREKIKDGTAQFIERVKLLQYKGFKVVVGYLTYPALFPRMAGEIDELKSQGIKNVNAKVFRGFYNGKKYPAAYTREERDLISKYILDPREMDVLEKKVNFFGKLCAAGGEYFKMDPAGNIIRCSSSMKRYGNFFEGKYRLDEGPKPCPMASCNCPYEGFRYLRSGKGTVAGICAEVLQEIKGVTKREITLKKLIRYFKERVGMVRDGN